MPNDCHRAASERPTVEKIRAQLGTGSPNTVSRMLETWRGALATRLGQVLALPDVPVEAGQAFAEVWRLAVGHAESLAQAALAQEQNALLAAQTSLAQERKIWEIAVAEAQEFAEGVSEDSASLNCLPRKLHSAERLSCTLFLPLLRNEACRFHKCQERH